jgi:hypothetical protein
MQRKTLFAALVAAAFAVPLAANAGGTGKHTASTNGANDGGAAAMFKSMDKNGDGFISKDEAKGTPHDGDFASLDKDGDGKLSAEEHANAKEHVAARAKAGSSGSTASTSSTDSAAKPSSGTKTY